MLYACLYILICKHYVLYACIYAHMYVHIHTFMSIHTCTHACTHTHTNTHTWYAARLNCMENAVYKLLDHACIPTLVSLLTYLRTHAHTHTRTHWCVRHGLSRRGLRDGNDGSDSTCTYGFLLQTVLQENAATELELEALLDHFHAKFARHPFSEAEVIAGRGYTGIYVYMYQF